MTEYANPHGPPRQTPFLHAEVTSAAGVFIEGEVVEVDMTGLRMASSRDLPVGSECTVTMVIDEHGGHVRVPVRGEISAADDTGMSIAFHKMDNSTLDRLRDIVSHNLLIAHHG